MALTTQAGVLNDAPPPLPHLLDILEMLPLDVVQTNLWFTLRLHGPERSDSTARGHFRLICRQTCRLANALTTTQRLHLRLGPYNYYTRFYRLSDPGRVRPQPLSIIEAQAALLQQLPWLTALMLIGRPDEPYLMAALAACGRATQGRVCRLAVCCSQLTPSTFGAIPAAFPRLRELDVLPHSGVKAPNGWDSQVSLFQPMYGWGLTKLFMFSERATVDHILPWNAPNALRAAASRNLLASLSGLSTLCYLDHIVAAHLHPLSRLTSLRHLSICSGDGTITLAEAAPLFSSTHLTHLDISKMRRDEAAPASQDAAALARLGALVNLRSLRLWDTFCLRDADVAALRPLTRLTSLCVNSICTVNPGSGHLPSLECLHLERHKPGPLLRELLPLLLLPALRHFRVYTGGVWGLLGEDS